MAGNVRGNRTLTGSWGEVWVDGEKIFVLQKIEQKVEVNREDVQMGMDVPCIFHGLMGQVPCPSRRFIPGQRLS